MDNRALAAFIKTELSKVTHAIDSLILKISPPRQENKAGVSPEKGNTGECGPAPSVSIVPPPPANPKQSKHGANTPAPRRTFRRKIWRQTKRIFFKKDRLEKAGIVAGIAYAVITIIQWRDLNKNFVLDQRAWVGHIDTTDFVLRIGEKPTVRHWFMNTGKTPALDFKARMGALFLLPSEQFSPQYGTRTTRIPISNAQIMPGQKTMFAPVESSPITPTAFSIDSLRSSRLTLYLFGEACYKDIFGRQHHTTFCEVVAPDLTNIVNCKTYNQQDNDPANNCPALRRNL